MKKAVNQKAASVLERKLNEIATLCCQIEQIMNLANDHNSSKPIQNVLSMEADNCAAQRYREIEAERLSAIPPGTSPEVIDRLKTLALAEAGHPDHPGFFLWRGTNGLEGTEQIIDGIDFASDLHISHILRQITLLRHYAELAANSERKLRIAQQNSHLNQPKSQIASPSDPRKRDPIFNPILTAAQKKALEYDVQFLTVGESWEFKPPSASSCATHVGVTDQAISKWRNDTVYAYQFERMCLRKIALEISARRKSTAART